jgi:ParB-like chromosome segregation protein Spo0J
MMNIMEIARSPLINLDLRAINDDPGPFCMSYEFALDPLILSIHEFGLINLPIVVTGGEGRVDVVSGYRRILALKDIQTGEIPCRDATDSGLSPLQLLLLNLHENHVTRVFNDVEKAMILARLVYHIPREEVIHSYMPLLSLPPRESTLDLFLNIEGQNHTVKRALAKGEISVKAFEAILEVDSNFRSDLIKSILNLRLTFNQQLQFIELTNDICIRDGIDIPGLFNQTPFVAIVEDEKLNLPQKTKAILALLRSVRFPFLIRSEKSFRKTVSELGLSDQLRISHPPFFEGPGYRLEVNFRNGRQLKHQIKTLNNLEGLDALTDPWQEEER